MSKVQRKKLPPDVRMECVSLVKGYDRRLKEYRRRVNEIMDSTAGDFLVVKTVSHSNPTMVKTELIERLESFEEVKKLRAVQKALLTVEPELRKPILCNIRDRAPFAGFGVEGYSETTFRRRRNTVIAALANERGYTG